MHGQQHEKGAEQILAVRHHGHGLVPQRIIGIFIIFICNAGVFAPFSDFLRSQIGQTLIALGLSSGVAVIATAVGLAAGHLGGRLLNGITGAIVLTFVNSMLIIVFASHFFGPRAPLISAAYTLPFFLMMLPLRWAVKRLERGKRGPLGSPIL